jgi:hypothetical protein
MINPKPHMKLLTWLFLLSPALLSASSVQYTLDNSSRILFSFIAPDYITSYPGDQNPYPGIQQWTLIAPQMLINPCNYDHPFGVYCDVKIREYSDSTIQIRADERYEDGTSNNLLLGFPYFPIALNQIGSSQFGNITFSISLTDAAPTYAPEPQTWGMMFTALALISWCVRSKQAAAFHNQS